MSKCEAGVGQGWHEESLGFVCPSEIMNSGMRLLQVFQGPVLASCVTLGRSLLLNHFLICEQGIVITPNSNKTADTKASVQYLEYREQSQMLTFTAVIFCSLLLG